MKNLQNRTQTITKIIYKKSLSIILCLGFLTIISCDNLGNKLTTEKVNENISQENQLLYIWSLNAILNKENTANNFLYGGEKDNHTFQNDYQKALKEWWGIANRFDSKTTIETLIAGKMHHDKFKMEFAEFFTMPDAQLDKVIENETEYKALYQEFKNNKKDLSDKGIIAWDLVRASSIIAWSYNARYITKRQAYEYSLEVGKALQENFNSYNEMSENYLLGYFYWSNDKAQYNKRLQIRQDILDNKNSAWNIFPFKYDMTMQEKSLKK